MPPFSIDWLPAVTPSLGARSVSPRNHPHPVERQVEFLRGDLRQGREMPWPSSTLPVEDRRDAVRIDANPGVEHAVIGKAAGQPGGCSSEGKPRRQREGDRDAAEPGGDVAP